MRTTLKKFTFKHELDMHLGQKFFFIMSILFYFFNFILEFILLVG